MLDAWGQHQAVRRTLEEASTVLRQDVAALIASGSKEDLALTTNTQPVMLVAGIAAWRAWVAEGGPLPDVMAGHSLGEYTALVAAGALDLATALPLVRLRAQAMQDAVPAGTGAMAAILGLSAASVQTVCAQVMATLAANSQASVEAVNFNDPLQTVIAGSKGAVEQACVALKAAGAKRALLLPVSAPFHSRLMRPAAEKLKVALAQASIHPPRIAIVNNIDVQVQQDADAIRAALYRQAFGPVRWVEGLRACAERGARQVVEFGPGKALQGMAKRTLPNVPAHAVFDPASLKATLAQVLGGATTEVAPIASHAS